MNKGDNDNEAIVDFCIAIALATAIVGCIIAVSILP